MDSDERDRMIIEMHTVLLGANGDLGLVGLVNNINEKVNKNKATINKICGGIIVLGALAGSAITVSITL